jgi:PAS domain S-box-containing protein
MLLPGILQLVREFPEPVLLVSATGEILASNTKAARIFALGQNPGSALPGLLVEPPDALLKYLTLCVRTNDPTPGAFTPRATPNFRCRFQGSGMALSPGQSRCVWLTIRTHVQAVSPFLALNQRVESLLGTLHARTRAEATLRAHSAQFEALLNQSPLGIYLVDSRLRVLQMNPLAEQDLGVKVGTTVEETFSRILPPAVAEETLSYFRRTLQTGEPFIVPEATDSRVDPSEIPRYYTWQVHRIPLPDGTHGLVCYFQDVSARRQAEEALRKTEKLAAVGRLAASIAHEINNPLEAVTNLLYLARTDASLDDETRHYLEQADSELERITHLARQTLGFYRDSTAPICFEPSALIDSVLALYAHRFRARKVRLVAQLQKAPPIFAFAGEFRQVLSNLVTNALDAMADLNTVNGQGGVLTVRARHTRERGRDGVRITIADTGSGITADRIDRIFDAFFTTKKDTGTGLGLWLTREIVQKHEGRIHVRSHIGPNHNGTVFIIFWPTRPVSLTPPQEEQQTAAVAV